MLFTVEGILCDLCDLADYFLSLYGDDGK